MIDLNKEIFDEYMLDKDYYDNEFMQPHCVGKVDLTTLIDRLFNECNTKDIQFWNLLYLGDVECVDESYGTKYYDNVLSYNGKYIYVQYRISDFDGLEIDEVKKVELRNIVKGGLNSCKYEFYDADGKMAFFDYERTIFDEEGNFIDCKRGIKQTLDDLGIELLNNVVVKYNTNLSKIRNINKSNLNSDYVKLFFAVITSYNEKVDFFKTYDKIKEYKGF